MAEPVQDQGSQGGEAPGIFDSYLNAVPEDARETVASYLKDAEKNVNERLSEAAELKKTWEPYQQVDTLTAYPPEQLSELLSWHQQVTSSDEAFQEWLANAAKEAGLTPAEEQELGEAEEQGELTREQVQQLIQQTAEERVAPLEARLLEREQAEATSAEEHSINSALDEIAKEAKADLSEDVRAVIIDLGMPKTDQEHAKYAIGDAGWVRDGFDRYQQIVNASNKAFVTEKANQPEPALSTGGTAAQKAITGWDDAKEALRERLRQT